MIHKIRQVKKAKSNFYGNKNTLVTLQKHSKQKPYNFKKNSNDFILKLKNR